MLLLLLLWILQEKQGAFGFGGDEWNSASVCLLSLHPIFFFFFLSFPFCGSIFRGKWKLGAELDGSRLPEYLFDSTAGDTVWEDAPE